MPRALVRAIVASALGVLAGAALLAVLYPSRAAVVLQMDRDLPSFASGFHGVERSGDETFVWTSDRAVIRLAGLDRRGAWTCTVRVRGPREGSLEPPRVTLSIDGTASRTVPLTNDYEDVGISVPPRAGRPGLTLSLLVAPTFVPGPADSRVLGAQVDQMRCVPEGWVWPPASALRGAAVGGGLVALLGAATGAPLVLLMSLVAFASLGQAVLLTTGGGVFGGYPALLISLAAGAAAAAAAVVWAPRLWRHVPLSGAALTATLSTAVIFYLKAAALTHPAKALVDAVFQAHRLEWVMAGRYFFTQPLPDGVAFPYAIGLYVTAMPWAGLVTDHVLLLRIVVLAFEAVAGLLLYAVVSRGFDDRRAGVLAVLLFHLVPLPYVVIGNANLTNAFGQAVALAAMALVAIWPPGGRAPWRIGALAAVTALAFLSHVSTFMLLGATLSAVAAVLLVAGGRDDRRLALSLIVATMLALVVSGLLYYRHFPEVYERAFSRVRAQDVVPAAPAALPPVADDTPAVLVRPLRWHERAVDAASQTMSGIGWPMLALAACGAWRVARRGARDRASLLVAAWVGAWAALLLAGTTMRVDTQYQRYAAEFLGRVNLASYPAAVILASLGASACWLARPRAVRAMGMTLCAAAAAIGVSAWLEWVL